jgi:hypothetical protein
MDAPSHVCGSHLFESNSASLAEKMDAAARKARSKKKNDMVLVS